jgi:hypothetical protein
MATDYLTLWHAAGYGRDDHLAGEVIARAARILGWVDADDYIMAAVGMGAHAVPQGNPQIRVPYSPAAKRAMERAIRDARHEFARRPDCSVSVRRLRTRVETDTRDVTYLTDGDRAIDIIYGEIVHTEVWEGGRNWRAVEIHHVSASKKLDSRLGYA